MTPLVFSNAINACAVHNFAVSITRSNLIDPVSVRLSAAAVSRYGWGGRSDIM